MNQPFDVTHLKAHWYYSMPELESLIAAADAVRNNESPQSPLLVILRKRFA